MASINPLLSKYEIVPQTGYRPVVGNPYGQGSGRPAIAPMSLPNIGNLARMGKQQLAKEFANPSGQMAVDVFGNLAADVIGAPTDLIGLMRGAPMEGYKPFSPSAMPQSTGSPMLGSENIRQKLKAAGITSGEERPLTEIGLGLLSPAAIMKGPAIARAAGRTAAETAVNKLVDLEQKYGLPTSPTMNIVPAQGNLNLTTRLDEQIKGPETQTVFDLLKQVQGKPGVTREGLKQIAAKLPDSSAKITKQQFTETIPASQYDKVDLKSSGDSIEHYFDVATNEVTAEEMAMAAGIRDEYVQELMDLRFGFATLDELTPDARRQISRVYGIDDSVSPDLIPSIIDDINADYGRELIYERTYDLMEEAGGAVEGYPYEGVQRLVTSKEPHDYFEFGVTHPSQTGEYRHYSSDSAPEGLVGHVRGSYSATEPMILEGNIKTRPNSYVPEEFQADVQKHGEAQEGPLHQVHGTLFKSAIQDAAERGADYFYLPTSRAIGKVRNSPGGEYATIYDDSVVKEGLNQLTQIPGAEIIETPRQVPWTYRWTNDPKKDVFNVLGIPKKQQYFAEQYASHPYFGSGRVEDTIRVTDEETAKQGKAFLEWVNKNIPIRERSEGMTPEIQLARMIKEIEDTRLNQIEKAAQNPDEFPYYVIKMSPEAREYILEGPGQSAPGLGYAAGGLVASDYDEEQIDRLSDEIFNFAKGGVVDKVARAGRKGQYMMADLVGLKPEVQYATETPERYFPANEQHNSRGDAMRHILFQAELMRKYGETPAKIIGFMHENLSGPQGDAEKAMDEYNDRLGREIGRVATDRADLERRALEAIEKRQARTLSKEQMSQGYAEGGLVYNDDEINNLADQLLGA
jgi:hypothetical protein